MYVPSREGLKKVVVLNELDLLRSKYRKEINSTKVTQSSILNVVFY